MLDNETKLRINTARDILVGKVPDPKSQVEQITIALIYKFMDDMDLESEELDGNRKFFTGEYEQYAWHKLFSPQVGGEMRLNLYSEALLKLSLNPNLPQLFRDIFKNAYLPYRDPETLTSFLKEIDKFNYDHSERLGDAFEYLLSVLGSQGDAGQFRTPRHLIDFMAAIIDPKKEETILDPACGTAGFLIASYKRILQKNSSNYDPKKDPAAFELHGISLDELGAANGKKYRGDQLTPEDRKRMAENFMGYDISPDMVRLSLVNLYLHGFTDPHIYEYDTLTSEARWNEYYDIILANPPFMSPKGGIKPHKRFSIASNRSEVLFVDYIVEHLTTNGRAAIIVPEGVIFQSGSAYKSLRKMLVEENYLVGVISLPAGVFNPYSGVKTSILWIDKALAKKTDKLLFVKIENDGFDLGAQRRPHKTSDLPDAFRQIEAYKQSLHSGEAFDVENLTKVTLVEKVKLSENGEYGLSGERYIQTKPRESNWPFVKIGDIATIINGRAYNKEELLEDGPTPVLRVGNFFSNRGWYYSDLELPEDKYCNKGDLLYAWSASFGPKIWDGPRAIFHYHIWKIETKPEINKKFLYYILDYDTENIKADGGRGIAMVHITKSGMEEREIPLPPLAVQEGIVREIEAYQRIIDGARQVVENYEPLIEIDAEWEIVELGELAENLDSQRKPVTKSDRTSGVYPYYGASGIVDYVEDYIFDGEYLLISEDGANLLARVTPIAFTATGKIWVNNHAHILKFKEKVTHSFVEYYLNQIDLSLYITGSAQPKLNQAALNSIPIPLPDLTIQQQIVEAIERELTLVAGCKELVAIFEEKIRCRIARLWGEEKQ